MIAKWYIIEGLVFWDLQLVSSSVFNALYTDRIQSKILKSLYQKCRLNLAKQPFQAHKTGTRVGILHCCWL